MRLLIPLSLTLLRVPAAAAAGHVAMPQSLRARAAEIRWTPALTERLIREMPKVETHLHLDGSLTPGLIKELADAQNYAPLAGKSVQEIASITVVDKPRGSIAEVLAAFRTIYPLLQNAAAVERTAYNLAARARAQHIRYMEVRFAPALQAAEGFNAEQVLQAALKGLERGEKDFGVRSGVIICLIRPFPLVDREKNAEMLELAIKYRGRGVVGIDLAGDEAAAPLSDYKDFYVRAKENGLHMTAHAGEAPKSRDIETAITLGVERLGHATLLAQNPELFRRVRNLAIPIEVNLTSNLRTGAIKTLEDHPVKDWYKEGIPLTISTDDPGVFGIDLNHEYRLLSRRLDFSAADIMNVSFQGIDALFLPPADKEQLRRSFEAELIQLLQTLKKTVG